MKSEVEMTDGRIRITRVFEAPRSLVFSWWARAEKLQQWSGCKGATNCTIEMDFRPGGSFTQKMLVNGECEFSFSGTYEEIVEPERIVYTAKLGPVDTRVTVEFFEQGKGTKVVLTQDGLPDEFMRSTVSQGTSESLDKLETLVADQTVSSGHRN